MRISREGGELGGSAPHASDTRAMVPQRGEAAVGVQHSLHLLRITAIRAETVGLKWPR